MVSREQFVHIPLKDASRQFRTVTLCPAGHGDSITGKLAVTNLNDQYHALSYLWGPETPVFSIELEGKVFQVRENLYHFLRRAQARFPNTPFFIDAICIDQVNIPERNQQVQIMGQIYKHSQLTVSWLGHGNPEVEPALPFISDIAGYSVKELETYYDGHNRRERQQAWSSVYLLKDLRYWTRVWIVQEILKPSDILLVYGTHELPWTTLSQFFYKTEIANPSPIPLFEDLVSSRVRRFANTRHQKALPQSDDPLDSMRNILMQYAPSQCSETRDRIFALLSLGRGGDAIKVDYAMHPAELFMKSVALWGAQEGSNALVLAKILSDGLLPMEQQHLQGGQNKQQSFVLKLMKVEQLADHSMCAGGRCAAGTRTFRYHISAGRFWKTDSHPDLVQDGKCFLAPEALSVHIGEQDMASIELDAIKGSEVHCSDIIVQILNTTMFLIARRIDNRWTIAGRLSIFLDEVDGQSRVEARNKPWSQSLAKRCTFVHLSDACYEISLDAMSLKSFLTFVEFEQQTINLQPHVTVPATLGLLRWNDDATATYPLQAIHDIERLFESYHRSDPGIQVPDAPATITITQTHQALKMSTLNLESPEDFKPLPSWKQLLGRT